MTSQANSASTSYVLSPQAYTIPILHAAKHLSHTVLGVFLGRSDPSNVVQIDLAVPLIHTYISLSPMLEAALDSVEMYAASQGLRIVGCYEAREEGEGFSRTGEKFLRTLRQISDDTFGVTLNNERLGAGQWPYTICIPPKSPDAVLKSLPGNPPSSFSLNSEVPARALTAIRTHKLHLGIADFDDQLEDASLDWPNNKATHLAISKHVA